MRNMGARILLAVLACITLASAARAAGAGTNKGRSGGELLDTILSSKSPVKAGAFFTLKPAEIQALTEALITRMDANLNKTAASVSSPSWAATMQPLVDNSALYSVVSSPITFPSSMSTDKAARDASLAASDRISQWSVDAGMREDVYDAIKAYNKTAEAKALKGEQERYLRFSLRDSRRSGLDLPKDKRDELAGMMKRMSKLGLDFSACLDADTTQLSFLPSELNGTTPEFVAGLKRDPKDASRVIVTLKYPDVTPIQMDCTVESTRKAVDFAFNNVCAKENTQRLDELIALRAKAAALLGYPTWAAYAQETLMAKNPQRVDAFLTDLRGRLLQLRDREFAVLLDTKRKDQEAKGAVFDGAINAWESGYYTNQVEKRDYQVDKQEVQKYFPIEVVVPALLDIYQTILGLKFEKDAALTKEAWAAGVDAYKVFDAKSRQLLGVFYLDLHPRDGKYGHAAMFGLQPPSVISAAGGKNESLIGVGALMCNFPESTPAQPSLLPHDDVVTLFHEMGHMFHQILGRTQIASFAGTNVDTDFVEAPSQMLENWCWEPEVLKRISKHYKTGERMPDALIDRLVKSRNANGGVFNTKQLAYALYDQKLHTGQSANSTELYAQLLRDITRIPPQKGTHFPARFGHLIGYDAKYYSYLWSKVFAQDMYATRFKKEGVLSPKPGMDYRRMVLAPGGSQDADALLLRFLGRPPNSDAFFESLGLTNGTSKAAPKAAESKAAPKAAESKAAESKAAPKAARAAAPRAALKADGKKVS